MIRNRLNRQPIVDTGYGMFIVVLFGLLGALHASADQPPERIAWRKAPITISLPVGAERLVSFPETVKVGLPPHLQTSVRVQSIAGTLYLLAREPFEATRVIVSALDDTQIYVLDLSATEADLEDDVEQTSVMIYRPDETEASDVAVSNNGSAQYGYVLLTRFAAQQLYAPARLLNPLVGVVRAPIKRETVALVRGGAVVAEPLIAWRAGPLHLTAVKVTNQTANPLTLDPRTLRGQWLSATFQHNRLLGSGSEADRTVVYLISDRPFADAF